MELLRNGECSPDGVIRKLALCLVSVFFAVRPTKPEKGKWTTRVGCYCFFAKLNSVGMLGPICEFAFRSLAEQTKELQSADGLVNQDLQFSDVQGIRMKALFRIAGDASNVKPRVSSVLAALVEELLSFLTYWFLQSSSPTEKDDKCRWPLYFELLREETSPVDFVLRYISSLLIGQAPRLHLVAGTVCCDVAELLTDHYDLWCHCRAVFQACGGMLDHHHASWARSKPWDCGILGDCRVSEVVRLGYAERLVGMRCPHCRGKFGHRLCEMAAGDPKQLLRPAAQNTMYTWGMAVSACLSIADCEREHKVSKTVIGTATNMTWDTFSSSHLCSTLKRVRADLAHQLRHDDVDDQADMETSQSNSVLSKAIVRAKRPVDLFRYDLLAEHAGDRSACDLFSADGWTTVHELFDALSDERKYHYIALSDYTAAMAAKNRLEKRMANAAFFQQQSQPLPVADAGPSRGVQLPDFASKTAGSLGDAVEQSIVQADKSLATQLVSDATLTPVALVDQGMGHTFQECMDWPTAESRFQDGAITALAPLQLAAPCARCGCSCHPPTDAAVPDIIATHLNTNATFADAMLGTSGRTGSAISQVEASQGIALRKFSSILEQQTYKDAEKRYRRNHNIIFHENKASPNVPNGPNAVEYEELCGPVCKYMSSSEFLAIFARFKALCANLVSKELKHLKSRDLPTIIAASSILLAIEVHVNDEVISVQLAFLPSSLQRHGRFAATQRFLLLTCQEKELISPSRKDVNYDGVVCRYLIFIFFQYGLCLEFDACSLAAQASTNFESMCSQQRAGHGIDGGQLNSGQMFKRWCTKIRTKCLRT